MNKQTINDQEFVHFLKWCLPKLDLCWPGFRKVRGTIRKRLARRMWELELPDLAAYQKKLEADPSEWRELDRMFRIPISRFYRDRNVYELLDREVLPSCADVVRKQGRRVLRILSAGCASGEEPYTINLIWKLRLSERYPDVELQVFALDIDDVMLHRAEMACYSASSFRDVPADLFENGFYRSDGEYCLRDAFRLGVRFEKADLRETFPDGPFDLILCRNTAFTYFDDATQVEVFARLDANLRDSGYLIIGSHESLPPRASAYHQLSAGVPVYRKGIEAHSADFGFKVGSKSVLVLDGSYGEGGGQILRSALSLSSIIGQSIRIENIRAGRRNPGLAAQHVTSVRAVAALCDAEVHGDAIGASLLEFSPQRKAEAGTYQFDVSAVREGRSAGSAPLVLQAVIVPLALAGGQSEVTIYGGTHVPWSPSFDYLEGVWLPTLNTIGISAKVALEAWGWYPAGGGRIRCTIEGSARALKPVSMLDRGSLEGVTGRAVVANLPGHIAERMAEHARELLAAEGIHADIAVQSVASVGSGAGIFLTARYQRIHCGFTGLGKCGKPAEKVAAESVGLLLPHRDSGAAFETNLADQIILPLALAPEASEYSVERVSHHLETNAWLVEQFGLAQFEIQREADGTGIVRIIPEEPHK